MKVLSVIAKIVLAATFALGLDFLPFISAGGIDYLVAHGKTVLCFIVPLNVFIGGAVCGGFLSKDGIKEGFKNWGLTPYDGDSKDSKINPTYGFAILILIWACLEAFVFIEA